MNLKIQGYSQILNIGIKGVWMEPQMRSLISIYISNSDFPASFENSGKFYFIKGYTINQIQLIISKRKEIRPINYKKSGNRRLI